VEYLWWVRDGHDLDDKSDILSSIVRDQSAHYLEWIGQVLDAVGKRVSASYTGTLAPSLIVASFGSSTCVFEGVNVPFELRRTGECYKLVRSCYLHEMMDGQALQRDDWQLQEILLGKLMPLGRIDLFGNMMQTMTVCSKNHYY
jgi:hypothetical protein